MISVDLFKKTCPKAVLTLQLRGQLRDFTGFPFPIREKYQRTHKDTIYFEGLDFFMTFVKRKITILVQSGYLCICAIDETAE